MSAFGDTYIGRILHFRRTCLSEQMDETGLAYRTDEAAVRMRNETNCATLHDKQFHSDKLTNEFACHAKRRNVCHTRMHKTKLAVQNSSNIMN